MKLIHAPQTPWRIKNHRSILLASQLKETDLGSFLDLDEEVMDSIELEMKLRLAELQRRYKEKQRELAKLTPKKDKDCDKEKEADKSKYRCVFKSI